MSNRFQNKNVMIVGATGGLGSAFARAFAAEGACLILAGRDEAALQRLAAEFGETAGVFKLDLAQPERLADSRELIETAWGQLDVAVNATGADVRRPLDLHVTADVQRLLDVNLRGAIGLTQGLLPMMRAPGVIVHVGGFADGRLAFPYHTVDVATRAGLFSFVEAINRELTMERRDVIVSYFSPSPTNTEAERPFHPIWNEMGVKIEPLDRVVAELLEAVHRRERVHIMGGLSTRLFAKLNAAWPQLADRLAMNRYGRILQKHLSGQISEQEQRG